MLGCGYDVTVPDTVPFAIWSAAKCLHSYPEAMVQTASVGGDCDTNCAIVGGIVACHAGLEGIPPVWRERKEQFKLAG